MNIKKKRLLLLVIIYLAFISLGVPDGVLGVAWPTMRLDMGQPLESMGILTTTLFFMSAFSSFVGVHILKRLGTGGTVFLSGLLTGTALLGYSLSQNFIWLWVCTLPLGMGQGAVDTGLNLYVSEHYSARHMNWLHCFWGLGASAGPVIMTGALTSGSWRDGYSTVSGIQLTLTVVLLISLISGLWKVEHHRIGDGSGDVVKQEQSAGLYRFSDQILAVFLFFLYSGMEFSISVWMNSVLVESRGMSVYIGGLSVTLFYGSIMAGRFISGMIVERIGNMRMIQIGLSIAAVGGVLTGLSWNPAGILTGAALMGLGLAPFYPCLMHETPMRFTKEVNKKLIGYQVGAACLGGSIMSSGTGIALSWFSLELLFPIFLLLLAIAFTGNQILDRRARRSKDS